MKMDKKKTIAALLVVPLIAAALSLLQV